MTKIKQIITHWENPKGYQEQLHIHETEIDHPYTAGSINFLLSHKAKLIHDIYSDVTLFSERGLAKYSIPIGHNGIYYLVLRKNYCLKQLIVEPEEVVMDIFYSLDPSSKTKEKREIKNPKLEVINLKEEIGNEKIREKELKEEIKKYTVKNDRLIYSFYNPTRRSSITISCKIIEDTDNTYSKIYSNPDDLYWRQYFIKQAQPQPTGTLQTISPVRELMNQDQLAEYLQVKKKTIQNWTAEKKIPFEKIPETKEVRYRKADIDEILKTKKIIIRKKKKS